jgi:hypothetical protein
VTTVLDALAAGETEVIADESARRVKASLPGPPTTLSL